MDWAPSLTSLRLLVPPLRLAAAALWRVVEEQKVEEFGKVEELVSVVTRLVPELLSRRQRATLIVGLRTKMILEMCRGELPADLHTVKSHIHHIRATDLLKAGDSDMEDLQERVLKMVLALLEDSVRRQHFFQEVFPVQYGPDFDKALQVLVGFFLSRLEQLLPVPSFKQLSVLLRCHSEELDVCVDSVCDAQNLLSLLHTDVCGALEENVLPEVVEDRIRSSLSLPLPEDVYQQVSGGWMLTSSKPETIRGEARDSASDSSEDMGREKEMSRGIPPETSSTAQPDAADAPARTGFHYAGRTVHRCQQCSKFFRFRSDLLKHQESHGQSAAAAALRVFQCVKCSAHFRTLRNLYRHNRAHKEKSTHKCPECGRLFSSLSRLVNHRRAHRRPAVRRNYACEQCHSSFGSYRASLLHQKLHNPKDARPAKPEQPPGKCRFCELSFGVDSELRSHLKTHAEFRPYICDQCGKCFSANSSLLAHLSNHTGEKPLLCSQCGKRFYSKIQLKSHMRCHSGERPHVCPYCEKQFSLSGNLKIHIRIHTGEKPYVCQQCGKGFVSAGCLQVHLRSHTGEKPYQCKLCGKKFVVSSHLTAHMCFHTGERPHSCLQCGKRFVRRYDLSKHMYTHIGKRPFPCPACPKAYTCRTHLNRHMKSHSA